MSRATEDGAEHIALSIVAQRRLKLPITHTELESPTLAEKRRMLSDHKLMAFVPTTDGGRAREFYEKTLGLRFVSDDDFALVMNAGGVTLRIAKVQELSPVPFTVLGWEVTGIGEVAASLKAKGVAFERYGWAKQDDLGIWTAPSGAKVAWFKDPDGNVLSITEHA